MDDHTLSHASLFMHEYTPSDDTSGRRSAAVQHSAAETDTGNITNDLFTSLTHTHPQPAVKLESVHVQRTRYLVVVSCMGRNHDTEESCLLGIDCNERTTVGLVLKVLADTTITLDGDGGFSVTVCGRHHIFKPVSVQAMW
ncbi:Protein phosphatase Slingshot 3 [Homalodisca vitripennis]|nr:Protein phosphatase Slingshot 3 [Homalodisca vitripennis]